MLDRRAEVVRRRALLLCAYVVLGRDEFLLCPRGTDLFQDYRDLLRLRERRIAIAELREPVLLKGGELKARHKISPADSIIAAYALVYKTTLVHKDPEFEAITELNQIKLPYE